MVLPLPEHRMTSTRACPSERGTDGRVLWHCHAGCSQGALLAELLRRGLIGGKAPGAQWMPPALAKRMLRGAEPGAAAPNGAERPRRRLERWEPIMPVPGDAPQRASSRQARPAERDMGVSQREGHTLFHVARFDLADGGKESCALLWRAGRPRVQLALEGPPTPRPLYGLVDSRSAQRPVLVARREVRRAGERTDPCAVMSW